MTPPPKIQSTHQGRWELELRKVPSVWMASLPTME